MNWQDDYQIDGGRRVGGRIASAILIVVVLITAAAYHHHTKDDAQAQVERAGQSQAVSYVTESRACSSAVRPSSAAMSQGTVPPPHFAD
jgi:hypothetical protein